MKTGVSTFFCFLFFCTPFHAAATDPSRVVTIVHPVRSRTLWKNLEAMQDQIHTVTGRGLPVTWLIQYDVLSDEPVIQLLKELPSDHEIGIFLEVDETLARDAFVPYLMGSGDWARADKVLLTGYTPGERKRMIDAVITKFHSTFGYYPVSVGAWYIDALSSQYLSTSYHIQAMMDCADQFQTDGYGVWGQPWGTAYYPSKLHPLVPASSLWEKLPIVKTQWAARDSVRGYGLTVADSIYSVQANDYAGQDLSISYFKKLLHDYLDSPNALNEVTVGIEVGQEGRAYLEEYQRQMDVLQTMRDESEIHILTMKQFSALYRETFPDLTPETFTRGTDWDNSQTEGYWYSSPWYRVGVLKNKGQLKIRDIRQYDDRIEENMVVKDRQEKLKRIIPALIDDARFSNAQMLLASMSSISVKRQERDVLFDIISEDSTRHVLILRPQEIVLDNHVIWSFQKDKTFFSQFRLALATDILNYSVAYPHQWIGGIRFSSISGTHFAGIWLYPDRLFGISTGFPFMGWYSFSFAVLSHFRSLPSIDLVPWTMQAII